MWNESSNQMAISTIIDRRKCSHASDTCTMSWEASVRVGGVCTKANLQLARSERKSGVRGGNRPSLSWLLGEEAQ